MNTTLYNRDIDIYYAAKCEYTMSSARRSTLVFHFTLYEGVSDFHVRLLNLKKKKIRQELKKKGRLKNGGNILGKML